MQIKIRCPAINVAVNRFRGLGFSTRSNVCIPHLHTAAKIQFHPGRDTKDPLSKKSSVRSERAVLIFQNRSEKAAKWKIERGAYWIRKSRSANYVTTKGALIASQRCIPAAGPGVTIQWIKLTNKASNAVSRERSRVYNANPPLSSHPLSRSALLRVCYFRLN